MKKSLMLYTIFLFCTFFNFAVSDRGLEHHCQAETLKRQDVSDHTIRNNTADTKETTDAEVNPDAKITTDSKVTTDTQVNTDAKINTDTQINTDTNINRDAKVTTDITNKWTSLKQLEYDILPKNRGLSAPHYPASNENRIDLFYDLIKNLGGGYVGVGTDQNFTFIAWARSEYAYLMDFDPVVVGINRIHLHFIDISPDYPAFRKLWTRKNRYSSLKIIRDHFGKDPEYKTIVKAYLIATGKWAPVTSRLRNLERLTRRHPLKTFVNQPADYDYIRTLVKQGRIKAVPGNLNGLKTFMGINNAARSLGVPIRVLYTSNAEDYFRSYSQEFRKNILDMPVDQSSLLVRTCSVGARRMGFPKGELFPQKPYHYNVQPLQNMQEWMKIPSIRRITMILSRRTKVSTGLSIVNSLPEVRNKKKLKGRR